MISAPRWRSLAILWCGALVIKLCLSYWLPMSLDECYYWAWGRHPQLSYFDHPGMVAWLFWLGEKLSFLGGQAARWPSVFLGHITFLIWILILDGQLSFKQDRQWLWIVLLSPLWGWGSLLAVPDVPFLFFWSVSILAFLRLLKSQKITWYALLGCALGLGFCSKYHTVLFVPAAVLYLIFDKRWRQLRPLGWLVGFLCGVVFSLPVLIWNEQNDWVSFRFQLSHGLNSNQHHPFAWASSYLLTQFLILFPPFVIMAWRNRSEGELKSLHYLAWFPLAFFFVASFRARSEANWPIAATPTIFALAFLFAKDSISRLRWLKGTAYLWLLALVIVLSQLAWSWLPIDPNRLKTGELTHFEPFVAAVQNLDPVYGSSYQMAAYVSYRLKRDINKLYGINRKDFYDFYPPSHPSSDTFYWMVEGEPTLPKWAESEGYKIIRRIPVSGPLIICEVRKSAKAANFNFSSFPVFYLPAIRQSVSI
jgi:4-amino-4-deoxy-L-arabinose transferase-like glycosyltransferase